MFISLFPLIFHRPEANNSDFAEDSKLHNYFGIKIAYNIREQKYSPNKGAQKMKMFQYLTVDDKVGEEEFWVCEHCRKLNCDKILTGFWRLIDKCDCDNAEIYCTKCCEQETETADLAMHG